MRILRVISATRDPMLAGKSRARAHRSALSEFLEPPGVLVLDFSEIGFLSSSYFFGALWSFWTHEDDTGPSTFPVVANALQEISDEISVATKSRRTGAWIGKYNGQTFTPSGLIGFVDPAHLDALNRAHDGHGLSAVELASPEIKATAWNNRLNSLYRQRLLVRHQSGRKHKFYAPWRANANG